MIKSGVKANGVKPEIILGLLSISPIFDKYQAQLVITEIVGGVHSKGSLHYAGLAVDIRSKNVPVGQKQDLLIECRAALGDEFDMILEDIGTNNEHYHLEYQPK